MNRGLFGRPAAVAGWVDGQVAAGGQLCRRPNKHVRTINLMVPTCFVGCRPHVGTTTNEARDDHQADESVGPAESSLRLLALVSSKVSEWGSGVVLLTQKLCDACRSEALKSP